MRVLTLTLNVAIDQTVLLDTLAPGTVHRAMSVRYNAGGKGVNVASCLADWGVPVTATGLLGRENATIFETLCAKKGIKDLFVRVDGASRTNIKLVDTTGTTDINLPGVQASEGALAAVADVLMSGPRSGLAILAGSLPEGCPDSIYAQLVPALTQKDFRVILDASEAPLQLALNANTLPFCIKPNRDELSQWAGRPLTTLGDVATEALALHNRGIGLVVVSMGHEGALFVSSEGAILARGTAESVVSTVGAGDSMVAGIAAALCETSVNADLYEASTDAALCENQAPSLERIARLSTAFAVAKLGLLGPNLPSRHLVEQAAAAARLEHFNFEIF